MDHKVIFTTAVALLLVPSLVLVGFFIALTDHQKKKIHLGRRSLIWLLVQGLQSCLCRHGGLSISVMTGVCSGLFTPQQMKKKEPQPRSGAKLYPQSPSL